MKQRIRTIGIIKQGSEILFLKKNLNREDGEVVWELPTGKINFGEQPEEAMSRAIYENIGLKADSINLLDVVTFLSLDHSSRQGNLYIVYELGMNGELDITLGDRYTAYKFLRNEEKSSLRLDTASLSVLDILYETPDNRSYRNVANGATVYVDGCSRGNPGPSGVGYFIVGEDGKELKRGGEFIGFATSRVAEYYALKEGCEQALELGLKSVRFVNDNLMLVNQMNGVYKVKNSDVLPIKNEIDEMLAQFEACAFVHIRREQNTEADKEANLAVDRHFE